MDLSTSNHTAESHLPLHLDSNSNHVADRDRDTQNQIWNQAAADQDGSQTEVIAMDASAYKAAADGSIHVLKQMSEDDLQTQLSPKHNTVLHIAAQFGQPDCVNWILKLPSSSSLLQRPNLKGDTPLHLAAREGYLEVVKALLEAAKALPMDIESGVGADKALVRMSNKGKDTALHEAVRYRHSDVVKLLLKVDPEFMYGENISGGTPLYMAAERGFSDLVQIILENTCASPAYHGLMGRTALHAAVICNDQVTTKKILEWKPTLTKEVDENGWSPLHCAAYRGCSPAMVRQLIEKSDKSVPYLRIKDGNKTALHIAANCGHMKIVELLASHSPDCCEQVDDEGNNVFHFAMLNKRWYATGDLLDNSWLKVRGVMNEKNGEGDTPLHLISSYQINDPLFIRNRRVDKMAFNNQNFTAMDILSRAKDICGSKDLVCRRLFQSKEASVGPLRWQEAIKEDDGNSEGKGKGKDKGNEDDRGINIEHRSADIYNFIQRRGENHLIVAALIATVTFAAGFTLPGGYNANDGTATLTKKAAFRAFVVMDTIAMVLSVSAVFIYFFMSLHVKKVFLDKHIIRGFFLTMLAMEAMVVAFMTGLYAVLPESSGLPIFTCIICCCFFLSFYFEFNLFFKMYKVRIHWKKEKYRLGIAFHG